MDFKDALQAEILAKRRLLESTAGARKYVKRSDLVRQEEEAILERQCRLDEERQAKLARRPQRATAKVNTVPAEPPVAAVVSPHEQGYAKDTLPVRAEPRAEGGEGGAGEVLQSAMQTEEISTEMLQGERAKVRSLIGLFFKRLLREQGEFLEGRPEAERTSKEGRLAAAVHCQAKDHIKILLRLLRKDALEEDVFYRLTEICGFLQQRNYVRANDAYLRLAIGNAPWPIGVTAVGIHERSAQEKITSAQVAHVLNDETTRKWIQTVKRLMTFCQNKYAAPVRSQMMG